MSEPAPVGIPGIVIFSVVQMAWGEWRASAIKLGSFDKALDGPYRVTSALAIEALLEMLISEVRKNESRG